MPTSSKEHLDPTAPESRRLPTPNGSSVDPSAPLDIEQVYNQRLKFLIRVALLATIAYSGYSFWNHLLGRIGTDILGCALYFTSEFLRRKPGRLDLARLFFMMGLGVSFFIVPMFSGHFESNVAWLFGLVPLAASHVYGPRAVPTSLAFTVIGLLFVAYISPQLAVDQEFYVDATQRNTMILTSIMIFGVIAISSANSLEKQVSHLRNASVELIKSRAAVDAATHSKGVFLANMSHEIRTPMNGILGMLQELKKKEKPSDHDALVNTAWDSGNRLLDTLNNILDFSKMEAGKLSLLELEFQPKAVFDRIDQGFSAMAKSRGVELKLEVPQSCPAIIGDEGRLEQLLSILVDNAIRFSDDGVVSLAIQTQIDSDSNNCNYKFIVRDQGTGISSEAQQRLFSEFESLDENNDQRSGIGLGLVLAKHLVELMQGSIQVTSELGQGTVFHLDITLPLASAKSQAPLALEEFDLPLCVLVVDDDPINRRVATLALEGLGCQVEQAASGVAAVSRAQSSCFDLIFMDLHMPGQSGIESAKTILQSEGPSAQARIVAFSGDTDAQSLQAAKDAGMHDVLVKPFRHEQLLQVLVRQQQRLHKGSEPKAA